MDYQQKQKNYSDEIFTITGQKKEIKVILRKLIRIKTKGQTLHPEMGEDQEKF